MAKQTPCPERARIFITSEPAITKSATEYVDDGKGGKKPNEKTVTMRAADTQLVIQVTESGRPIREWLSSTKRITAAEKTQLKALYDEIVASAVTECGGES